MDRILSWFPMTRANSDWYIQRGLDLAAKEVDEQFTVESKHRALKKYNEFVTYINRCKDTGLNCYPIEMERILDNITPGYSFSKNPKMQRCIEKAWMYTYCHK